MPLFSYVKSFAFRRMTLAQKEITHSDNICKLGSFLFSCVIFTISGAYCRVGLASRAAGAVFFLWLCGGIGRRARLKIVWARALLGSTPSRATALRKIARGLRCRRRWSSPWLRHCLLPPPPPPRHGRFSEEWLLLLLLLWGVCASLDFGVEWFWDEYGIFGSLGSCCFRGRRA